jgi:hypothetical protein
MQSHYTATPQNCQLKTSPYSLEENLAEGRAQGVHDIRRARLFTGRIHICQLKRCAGGDPGVLAELLDQADAWGVQVDNA